MLFVYIVYWLMSPLYVQKLFMEKVLAESTGLPCFCFGHSTGAAIILKVIINLNLLRYILLDAKFY